MAKTKLKFSVVGFTRQGVKCWYILSKVGDDLRVYWRTFATRKEAREVCAEFIANWKIDDTNLGYWFACALWTFDPMQALTPEQYKAIK